jgi:hypothetical protein
VVVAEEPDKQVEVVPDIPVVAEVEPDKRVVVAVVPDIPAGVRVEAVPDKRVAVAVVPDKQEPGQWVQLLRHTRGKILRLLSSKYHNSYKMP